MPVSVRALAGIQSPRGDAAEFTDPEVLVPGELVYPRKSEDPVTVQ